MSKRKSKGDTPYLDDDFDLVDFNKGSSSKSFGSGGYSGSYGPYKGSSSGYKRCYESHPPLKLPGTELVIYGGSCLHPAVKDADIYIGFDHGMKFTQRSWPWKKGAEFLFEIRDMHAPSDIDEFRKLVAWTKEQLEAGKKVHCGCIGGHGRTGTFLAALVSEYGEKDAIAYVREHYCKKAVESSDQIKFLEKHFGVIPAKGSKSYASGSGFTGGRLGLSKPPESHKSSGKSASVNKVYEPIPGMGSIWGS